MSQKGTRVTCTDLDTGESESKDILNDWMLITDGRHYLNHVQRYANGTVILTIKLAHEPSNGYNAGNEPS